MHITKWVKVSLKALDLGLTDQLSQETRGLETQE